MGILAILRWFCFINIVIIIYALLSLVGISVDITILTIVLLSVWDAAAKKKQKKKK
ncbi:MAG: hypothetical protein Q6363_004260 [Candidatus Njordarchaeota archaeon]